MPMAARGLLTLNTIFSMDWDVTFRGLKLLGTGCYLYYNFNTGAVRGLPLETWAGVPAVTPVF